MLLAGCATTREGSARRDNGGWIDAHTHVWTDDLQAYPVGHWVKPSEMSPRKFTIEDWLATAEPAGVRRAVLVQHSPYYGNDSSYLVDCRRRYPGRFSIVGRIDEHEPDLRQRFRTLVSQGIRGLRISPTIHGDRTPVADPPNWLKPDGMRTLWSLAADSGVAICPILTPEFLPSLATMCSDFPATRCVIDHLAQVDLKKPEHVDSLLRLSKHRNVFVKVSAFYKWSGGDPPYTHLSPLIKKLVREFGANRLMWGSDSPYQLKDGNTYADSVNLIATRLDVLSPADRNAVLRDTAERVFFT